MTAPPLVRINAKHSGWRIALYIAAIMYGSIVVTALALHHGFLASGLTPESGRRVAEVTRFAVDYPQFMNVGAAVLVAVMALLARSGACAPDEEGHGFSLGAQDVITALCAMVVLSGAAPWLLAGV